MKPYGLLIGAVVSGCLISPCVKSIAESPSSAKQNETNVQTFAARGVVKELKADGRTVVLNHEAITNYMDAMTMPFHVRDPRLLEGIQPGMQVEFQLVVMRNESYADRVRLKGGATFPP